MCVNKLIVKCYFSVLNTYKPCIEQTHLKKLFAGGISLFYPG